MNYSLSEVLFDALGLVVELVAIGIGCAAVAVMSLFVESDEVPEDTADSTPRTAFVGEYDAITSAPKKTKLLAGKVLPQHCASPDGMAIGPDGCIYVSITQRASNWKFPAKIVRITADNLVEDFFTMPVNPATGKACPMGLVFDNKGDLYVADNQSSLTQDAGQSSLYRIVIRDGKAVRAEKVATGINAANGVTRWKDHIYVAEPDLRVPDENLSGVYRFAIADLKADAPIHVKGRGDPHLILQLETRHKNRRGANGIDFDSQGRLYVNNFGDSQILRYYFATENGPIAKSETFARFNPSKIRCVDGLHIDAQDNLWVADLLGNVILKITPEGTATIVARNNVSKGKDGTLDTPSECIRRGDTLYISNINIDRPPHKSDPNNSIVVLPIKADSKNKK